MFGCGVGEVILVKLMKTVVGCPLSFPPQANSPTIADTRTLESHNRSRQGRFGTGQAAKSIWKDPFRSPQGASVWKGKQKKKHAKTPERHEPIMTLMRRCGAGFMP